MGNNNVYTSIDTLYETAKEEYAYQRERLQKIEAKIELIITIISAVFTYEIANAAKVLKIEYSINSFENLKKFIMTMCGNFPYFISLILLIAGIILLVWVELNIKCKIIDVVKLYNKQIYKMPNEDVIPYLTALYVKCSAHNFKKINYLYRKVNIAIIVSFISILSFGLAYLF